MAACIVSFVDLDGIRHSVEVEAEGLYEASVLGLCAFRKHELKPGGLTQLEVEVRSFVKHTLTVTKVREWLQREAFVEISFLSPTSFQRKGRPSRGNPALKHSSSSAL